MTTGGNGEFPHLRRSEREKVLDVAMDQTAWRVPVIACTTACSTKHTISLTKHAEKVGAEHNLAISPLEEPAAYFRSVLNNPGKKGERSDGFGFLVYLLDVCPE
jgi:dihydrodipicolinate synthase/N-acetylneuraminate lyase